MERAVKSQRQIGCVLKIENLFQKNFFDSLEQVNAICSNIPSFVGYHSNNCSFSEQDGKDLITEYLNFYFNKDCRQDLNSFFNYAAYSDDEELWSVIGKPYQHRIHEVIIPTPNNIYNIICICHEFFHYMNFKKLSFYYDNLINSEFFSILNEFLFADYLDEKKYFKNSNVYEYIYKDRFNIDLNVNICADMNQCITNNFDFLENLGYYLSNINANRMVNIYHEDKKAFLKHYRALLTKALKIEYVLDYYNVSITNDKTRNTTFDLIKKYYLK